MLRKQKIIFILSLSLNAVLILLLISMGIKYAYYTNKIFSAIPKKAGHALISNIHEDTDLKQEMQKLKSLLEDFDKVLSIEPFDREKVTAHFSKVDDQLVFIKQGVNLHILNFLETL